MSDRKVFVLNEEFIAQLQNLVIYCMATGTHIVDHIRQMRLEESTNKTGSLCLTPEYLAYYEKTVERLKEEIVSLSEEKQNTYATDDLS
jgi:hypothetical protein